MFKKALFLLVFICSASLLQAQYEDPAANDSSGVNDSSLIKKLNLLENKFAGLELMLTASNGAFFLELSPFVGIKPVEYWWVCGGVHGAVLALSGPGNKARTYFGVHGFTRLVIAEQFFLHAEYRLLNGIVDNISGTREWVGSPILGGGLMFGDSWMLIGYAANTKFQEVNPFGAIVYRMGIQF